MQYFDCHTTETDSQSLGQIIAQSQYDAESDFPRPVLSNGYSGGFK